MRGKPTVELIKKTRNDIVIRLLIKDGFLPSEIAMIMNQSKQLINYIIKTNKVKS